MIIAKRRIETIIKWKFILWNSLSIFQLVSFLIFVFYSWVDPHVFIVIKKSFNNLVVFHCGFVVWWCIQWRYSNVDRIRIPKLNTGFKKITIKMSLRVMICSMCSTLVKRPNSFQFNHQSQSHNLKLTLVHRRPFLHSLSKIPRIKENKKV